MTLRDELGVRPDPDFDLELPAGWARHGVDDQALQALLAGVRKRCLQNHQLELFAGMKTYLEQAFEDMRRNDVTAYFCPTDDAPGTIAIPASINASIRRSEPGQTLDDLARSLIREQGATPLLGDKRTLRFETEKLTRLETESIVLHSVVYLTPVPGSMRRRALALVAGFARPLDVAADAPSMQAHRALFDACVSTLQWRAPAEPAPAGG